MLSKIRYRDVHRPHCHSGDYSTDQSQQPKGFNQCWVCDVFALKPIPEFHGSWMPNQFFCPASEKQPERAGHPKQKYGGEPCKNIRVPVPWSEIVPNRRNPTHRAANAHDDPRNIHPDYVAPKKRFISLFKLRVFVDMLFGPFSKHGPVDERYYDSNHPEVFRYEDKWIHFLSLIVGTGLP